MNEKVKKNEGMKERVLTLIEGRDGRLALHVVLLFSILLVRIVSLHVVPSIELEGIVLLAQDARSELERVAPLLVVIWDV